MEVLVVSKSFIIRDAMIRFFSNNFDSCKVIECMSLEEIKSLDLSSTDILFIDAEMNIVNHIYSIKNFYKNLKVVVFNKMNNKSIFIDCFKNKIESCIFDIPGKDDLIYIINTIIKGKKYYDLDLLEDIINNTFLNSTDSIDLLTDRENEVLDMVGEGFTNKEIAKNLYISEHTIKKHITSILYKLDMRSRKDLIIYKKEQGIDRVI